MAAHVDVVLDEVGPGGAGHHVQRGLGHVGVRVRHVLVPVELALHRRHVHHVPAATTPAPRTRQLSITRKDFKVEIESKYAHLIHLEITQEYKSGAMDPSCESAKLELLNQKKNRTNLIMKKKHFHNH